ncbi:hypothetical protein LTR53_005382 [Teratosphaeriaceae sp. CCFEE 6253]|nr:hypothetical protein LTR53_005382 [Teratosphaeriaceae sp. CCFEE 6253]
MFRLFAPRVPPPPEQAIRVSPLFRLPTELRLHIYSYTLADASLSPLYIEGLNVRGASIPTGHPAHRTALLRTCRVIHREAQPVLFEVHELHLLLRRPSLVDDHRAYPVVCSVPFLRKLLTRRIKRLSVTVEYGSSQSQQRTSVLLMRWVHLLLRRRDTPLDSLTLRCTDDERGRCSRTCAGVMGHIAKRFYMFDQRSETVFGPVEPAGCSCARAWTEVIGNAVSEKGQAEQVWEHVLIDLWRVTRSLSVWERVQRWDWRQKTVFECRELDL